MQGISDAAEAYLILLESEFAGELANHAIFSESVKYPSSRDARFAMVRLAYLQGQADVTRSRPTTDDFDRVVAELARGCQADDAAERSPHEQ